ncbi:putative nudC domain-containing protein 1 isoform X2 [Apostichopus japonicus]|uniref:NudC domain-containing protein 1 n=1 Tax=Stichopus japonicus TaxID=307972 RepID=A0A2G8LCN9_STIJA|nr:putative nudC domain-containing protein 1 isoform X2 [Apostichopus japonicus]
MFHTGVDVVQLSEDQYSVHHVRIFGLTNHLVLDQWNPNTVYFIDQHWNVRELTVTIDTQIDSPRTIFTIPDAATKRAKERLNASLWFPASDICVLSDGTGELYILSTVTRGASDAPRWKILWRGKVSEPAVRCVVAHASLRKTDMFSQSEDGSRTVDCLLLHIKKEEPTAEEENSETLNTETSFVTILEWLTLTRTAGDTPFSVSHHRQIKGKAAPLYAAVEETGRAVFIAGEGKYEIVYDSLKPVEKEKKDSEKDSKEAERDPTYTWTQTMEDLTVTFTVPQGTQKSDIDVVLTPNRLAVELKNGPALLQGPLFRDIDVSVSTWILEGRKLEVGLAKKEDEMLMWPEVVVGDQMGEYFVDPDQARIIHDRLAHLTSDELNPDPRGKNGGASSSSNCQMLEECDAYPENFSCMIRLDGETHQVTNSVNIGTNQWLFNAQLDPQKVPAICLRHDVDGLPIGNQESLPGSGNAWFHAATFNALGYVQASKRDKKFASCPPDTSYTVLCDCVRHVYIYRQPEGTMSPVKNRKTGKVVTEISKQQLVSLDCQDNILGMQTSNERIFILTSQRLYVIRVNDVTTATT